MRDPSPASEIGHDIDPVVELQSILSVIWNDPAIYNPITYAVCKRAFTSLDLRNIDESKHSKENTLPGLATVAALAYAASVSSAA